MFQDIRRSRQLLYSNSARERAWVQCASGSNGEKNGPSGGAIEAPLAHFLSCKSWPRCVASPNFRLLTRASARAAFPHNTPKMLQILCSAAVSLSPSESHVQPLGRTAAYFDKRHIRLMTTQCTFNTLSTHTDWSTPRRDIRHDAVYFHL